MENWLIQLLYVSLVYFLKTTVESFGNLTDNIFLIMHQLSKNIYVTEAKNYTVGIGLALISVMVIKQGIDVYVLHIDGDSDADALEIITRIAKTTAIIICGEWFINYLIATASKITSELLGTLSLPSGSIAACMAKSVTNITTLTMATGMITMVMVGIMQVALYLFVFKAAKRAAELILFAVLLPIIALDNLTTNKERWNSFKTELLLCIFGYIIQVFCYSVFSMIMETVSLNPTRIDYMIEAIVWLLLSLNAPKWLQKFTYSSGVGNAAKGGLRSAAGIIPTLIRLK